MKEKTIKIFNRIEPKDSLQSNLPGKSNNIDLNNKIISVELQRNECKCRKKAIKPLLKEVLYNSLAQAIFRIFTTSHLILKIFLFTFVFVSTSYSSYLVIETIMSYLSFGVTTTSRTIHETPTLFPKVTFCNFNMFQSEYAWNLTSMGLDVGNLSDGEKKMLGHDLNDILFDCKFNNEQCYSTDFIWSWDNVYGNCFTFNTGFDLNGNKVALKESTLSGPYYGLKLVLYVNVFEKLINSISGLGAVIRIGNSSHLTYILQGDGILVSPGSITNILINREFSQILPIPYSNCKIDENAPLFISGLEVYNLISLSFYDYTQQLCFIQCFQRYIIQKYNCSHSLFLSLFNVRKCSFKPSEIFDSSFIHNNCIAACPLECNQTLYKISTSSNLLNGYLYIFSIKSNPNLILDFINRSIDVVTVEKSIVNVTLFYDSLTYVLSSETPQWSGVSLLGSIGGNLSLFLGVSLFSLVELIEVILEITFYS